MENLCSPFPFFRNKKRVKGTNKRAIKIQGTNPGKQQQKYSIGVVDRSLLIRVMVKSSIYKLPWCKLRAESGRIICIPSVFHAPLEYFEQVTGSHDNVERERDG
ncbi:hypothetical protein TNCV_1218131 [Trichonephila clavipes]|nr:hypothetical protein TNCV_1218131 [Trichonephila clavipes]